MNHVEHVARALCASDGNDFDALGPVPKEAYLGDAQVAITAHAECLLSPGAVRSAGNAAYGDESLDERTTERVLRAAIQSAKPPQLPRDPEPCPQLSKNLVKGLTNESALVLWQDGEASDGGEHDIKNIRRVLAWLIRRELKRK